MNHRMNALYTLVVVTFLALGQSYAQEPPSQRAKSLTLKEAIDRAANEKISFTERMAVYEELTSRSQAERTQAFRALTESADDTMAAMAARSLLQDRSPDSARVISSRITKWSEPNQLAVLQEISNIGSDEALVQIPREVVRESAAREKSGQQPAATLSALDVAAVLLAKSSLASDRSLLATAVRAHPHSRGLWLALASQDTIEPGELELANSIYKNAEAPELVRVAAATAVAAGNEDAGAFVTDSLSSFLSRFSDQNLEEMVANAYSSKEAKENVIYFRQHLRLLSVLGFLRLPSSEHLTLKYLNARNTEIRMTLGLVAALRWPEGLLSTNKEAFSTNEYESLLVAVSILHPSQTSLVETRLGSGRLTELRGRFEKYGFVGVFGVPATVALGG
jgi:hypothetical protein